MDMNTSYPTTPAYNIPAGFTGTVAGSYSGSDIVTAVVNGEVLRGAAGGLRKFKSVEAAEKAITTELES